MTPDNLTFRRAIMKALMVSLNSIDKVKAFCNEIAKFDAEFDLISGRYVIDAKSIMGIFSLDISKPISWSAEVVDEQSVFVSHQMHDSYRQ